MGSMQSTTAVGVPRLYIYNAALAVIGATMGLPAVGSVIAGEWGVPVLLMAVGGCGLGFAAGFHSLRTDPTEFDISTDVLLLTVAGACVALTGTLLSAVPG